MLGPVGISILEALARALEPVAIAVEDQSHLHAGHAGARPGGESHFSVAIVAPAFAGKRPVERHRMVNAALADAFQTGMHALTIDAKPPAPGLAFERLEAGDPQLAALLADAGLDGDERDAAFLGLVDGRRLLACGGISLHDDNVLLRCVAVAREARGRGHGRAIVLRLLALARERGASEMWLLTQGAEGFFAGIGFTPAPRGGAPSAILASPQFAGQRCASATAMRRRLS